MESADNLFEPARAAVSAQAVVSDQQERRPKKSKEERIAEQREQLESRLAAGELDGVRTRVAYVLNQHPTCRNSDVELAIRYWKLFHSDDIGAESITFDALRTVTKMTSIARARATIQNDFGLFLADDAVIEYRSELEGSVRRKQRAAAQAKTPFVYVYADESGKTDTHYVVGSLWVSDVDEQAFKLSKALNEWRRSLKWNSEIHFAQATRDRKGDYLSFIREAMRASEYIGFKAVVLPRNDVRQRPTEDAVFELYYRLIVDGIHHEVDSGRLALPRNIVVHKDEDEGADKLHLLKLRDRLSVQCPQQFDNMVNIQAVNALKSSSNILMQLADVFTGSVSRLLNRPSNAPRNHKDEIAEGVASLLGLDLKAGQPEVRADFASVIRL
jgi:hypothetical protein